MQFAQEVAVLECSFLNHSQGILGVEDPTVTSSNVYTFIF
jgi:hypothetical protein